LYVFITPRFKNQDKKKRSGLIVLNDVLSACHGIKNALIGCFEKNLSDFAQNFSAEVEKELKSAFLVCVKGFRFKY
jgi:hypothetical protein